MKPKTLCAFCPFKVLGLAKATAETQPAVRECEAFLKQNKPRWDDSIAETYLQTNIALALAARSLSSWAATVPWPIFLNDVLPYARHASTAGMQKICVQST